jgi:hypothetical protein
MRKFAYPLSLLLSTTGLFLFIFAITFAYPAEVIPSALWGIAALGSGIWLSAYSEDKKDDDRSV